MKTEPVEDAVVTLRRSVQRLETVLGTLISWIAQSSVAPISVSDADELLQQLEDEDEEEEE